MGSIITKLVPPDYKVSIASNVWKWRSAFSILFFILGIVWISLFPLACITCGETKCRGTYLSENALMPGSSLVSFSNAEISRAKEFDAAFWEMPPSKIGPKSHQRRDWLLSTLRDMGVEANIHRYEVDGVERYNVYGVLRASRASGAEGMVLAVTGANEDVSKNRLHSTTRDTNYTSGLATSLALFEMLTKLNWLAKDCVLLIPLDIDLKNPLENPNQNKKQKQNNQQGLPLSYGIEAWLEAYTLPQPKLSQSFLRVGTIRGAIVVHASVDFGRFTHIGM